MTRAFVGNRWRQRANERRRRTNSGDLAIPGTADVGRELPPPRSLPATLRDGVLEARFVEDGYVVVDLLEPTAAADLLAACRELHPTPQSGWESDFYSSDAGVKATAHRLIADAFAPAVDEFFVDHRSIMHNFVLNWPGPDSGLVLHQHSTLVDERRFRSAIVWCALTSANEDNGTLHVVPRSHRVQLGPRPERSRSWHEPHEHRLRSDHLVSVEVQPGQAIIFDNQLLHASFHNDTDAPRLTAVGIVIPNAATPLFYEPIDDSRAAVHRLDPQFFVDNVAGELEWAKPEGLELIDEVPWEVTAVDAEEVSRWLGPGTCRHDD